MVGLKEELETIVSGLNQDDWDLFADEVSSIDPALGAAVQMHAASADGNSPSVQEWVQGTLDDADKLREAGVNAPAEARKWWVGRYG